MRTTAILSCSSIIALVTATLGCTSVDSADITTHGIQPVMRVSSSPDGPNSHVSVTLNVGGSIDTFVNLDSDESIVATTDAEGGAPVTLSESGLLGLTSYSGDVVGKDAGTVVTLNLTRTNGNENAPASTVTLTDPLALTAPASGGTVSRDGDDVTVTWTSEASEEAVQVAWSGDCVDAGSVNVDPPGLTTTIAKGTIKKREAADADHPVADDCPLTLSATRTKTGTVDPAFGGGSIAHSFSASVQLTSNP
jgi:hypothetical protein